MISCREQQATRLHHQCISCSMGPDVMPHGPADKEMEATVRWGGKGQPALVGDAVAQGHDAFNKTKDLPCEGSRLHMGAGIHCKPPAVSKWSHCAFWGHTVITNHWLHTQ